MTMPARRTLFGSRHSLPGRWPGRRPAARHRPTPRPGLDVERLESRCVLSATPTLIAEIDNVDQFMAVGNTLYFSMNDGLTGRELWKSDGTVAGTVQVKDINPGGGSSFPTFLGAVGSTLFFMADDGLTGHELWKTDGTLAGTVRIKDINPGSGPSLPQDAAVMGNTLYFVANDGAFGTELWKSDGSEAGTVRVKDIRPGVQGAFPRQPTAVGNTLYFTADDGQLGRLLWKTDGTEAGTVRVTDRLVNTVGQLTAVGNTLFFTADDGVSGSELWKSDGTDAGTVRVADIRPGSLGSGPVLYTAIGNTLYFTANDGVAGQELWRSDGTERNTFLVRDLRPGGDSPSFFSDFPVIGNTFYFVSDAVGGWELWKSDGTTLGTVQVADISPGSGSGMVFTGHVGDLMAVGNTLFFSANDGLTGEELWKSDGTAAGTVQVADVRPGFFGSQPRRLRAAGDTLFFTADWRGNGFPSLFSLPVSSGTDPGPGMPPVMPIDIADLPPTGFRAGQLTVFVLQQAQTMLASARKELAALAKSEPGLGLDEVAREYAVMARALKSIQKKLAGAYGRRGTAKIGKLRMTRQDLELADRILLHAWLGSPADVITQRRIEQGPGAKNTEIYQRASQQVLTDFSPNSVYGNASTVLGRTALVTGPIPPASGLAAFGAVISSTIGKLGQLGVASVTRGIPELSTRARDLANDSVLNELLNQVADDAVDFIQDTALQRLIDGVKRMPDKLDRALENVALDAQKIYHRVARSRLAGVYRGTVNWLTNNEFVPASFQIRMNRARGDGPLTGTITTQRLVVDANTGAVVRTQRVTGSVRADIDANGNLTGTLSLGGSTPEPFTWSREAEGELAGRLRESFGTSIWVQKK